MRYSKHYFEKYALLSLIKCFRYDFEDILDKKFECPDWQSEKLNIGIEVTRAINDRDGQLTSIINKYFNQGMRGEEIKNKISERHPQYSAFFGTINNISYCSTPRSINKEIGKIVNSINTKTTKLNRHFKMFNKNWLYVFADIGLIEEDILQIVNLCEFDESKKQYDKIFINIIDNIYVIDKNSVVKKVNVGIETLQQLKAAAQK